MSFHEALLNQTYWGWGPFSIFGLVITLGIGLSCICRLNAGRPKLLRVTGEQAMYLLFAAWAMEAFVDLLFFQMYSGFDVAIGIGIMLHLSTSYKTWQGDDCVCDLLNAWRREKRERVQEIHAGVRHGRRESDHH